MNLNPPSPRPRRFFTKSQHPFFHLLCIGTFFLLALSTACSGWRDIGPKYCTSNDYCDTQRGFYCNRGLCVSTTTPNDGGPPPDQITPPKPDFPPAPDTPTNTNERTWAISLGGKGLESGLKIAVDPSQNVYVAGIFSETTRLGRFSFTAQGKSDLFVAKLDRFGHVVWAIAATGTGQEQPSAITYDTRSKVLYVVGGFESKMTWQGNPQPLTSLGDIDGFISQIDPKTGRVLRNSSFGGTGSDIVRDLAVDAVGNLYLAGQFTGTMQLQQFKLQGSNISSLFVARFNPSFRPLWAKTIGGASTHYARSLQIDRRGFLYLCGGFAGTATFDNVRTVQTNEKANGFVAQMNPRGLFTWVQTFGGVGDDFADASALDSVGNLYVTGSYEKSATYGKVQLAGQGSSLTKLRTNQRGFFEYTVTSASHQSIATGRDGSLYLAGSKVVAKLSNNGQRIWNVNIDANDVALDAQDNLYVTGSFTGERKIGEHTLSSQGSFDTFIWKRPPSKP